MYRYFMKNRTYRFVNVLQDLVKSYNNRPRRSLGGNAPANVRQENVDEIRLETYLSGKTKSDLTKYDLNQYKEPSKTKVKKKSETLFPIQKYEMMSEYHN